MLTGHFIRYNVEKLVVSKKKNWPITEQKLSDLLQINVSVRTGKKRGFMLFVVQYKVLVYFGYYTDSEEKLVASEIKH